ncbi:MULTISPECIES: hypothetical protein [unclassified Sphingomonas]|jgi:hypothetical protein|uniref:hypothetical protein n=1 Tax=unclassified Sphingomonas TaxID=196159 RepID=UPI0006F620F2|nr:MULTISPECIES: hypothetical protein [unclassified Sphingomonas]KQN29547.1 hypothetical protein ASE88_11630 [Sphingomonas sp. Leaf38]KQN31259.1 hypothetical protein ASF00_00020 [Sphingomonas sp. Leaf34]
MQPTFLTGAGSQSLAKIRSTDVRDTVSPAQRIATCAMAAAIAAEAEDQRVTQRINGRQIERFR